MSLETVFLDLQITLRKLHDALQGLRTIAVEDQPPADGTVLVDQFGYAADDLAGWSEEAMQAVAAGRSAVAQSPADVETLRRSLSLCQERQNRILRRFGADIASHERMESLLRFGKERRGEWTSWSRGVTESIARCRPAIDDASDALLSAWRELSERIGMNSVTVRATNIGQQISLDKPEVVREGIP
jgi:hypothetical protein